MTDHPASLRLLLLVVAVLIVAYNAWRGWRAGFVRQAVSIVATLAVWIAAYFGGPFIVPFLRPIGLPDQALSAIGGILLGIVIYILIQTIAAVLFKKTSEQSVGIIRFGYGGLGAALGACSGIFKVWILLIVLRLCGTVAQTGVAVASHSPRPVNPVIRGLAQAKSSIDTGVAGTVAEHLDPLPDKLYTTLDKLGRVLADERNIARFLNYPGIKDLAGHSKITALQDDPAIARAALDHNFLALLSNPAIVSTVNDPDLAAGLRKIDLEKALNYALQPTSRPTSANRTQSRGE